MKEDIVLALGAIGFAAFEVSDTFIFANVNSFNNGGFDITIDLRDNRFTVILHERFSSSYLFFEQKFTDGNYIAELLKGSYPFDEWIIDNDGSLEKRWKERMIDKEDLEGI